MPKPPLPITVISGPTLVGKTWIAQAIRTQELVEEGAAVVIPAGASSSGGQAKTAVAPLIIDADTTTLSHSKVKQAAKKRGVILTTQKYARQMFPYPHRLIEISLCQN